MRISGVDTGTSLRHRDFRVHRVGRVPKCRVWHQITGTAAPTTLGVYNSNVRNAERAFLERYYYCEVTPGNFQPALSVALHEFVTDQFLLAFMDCVVRHVLLPPPAPIVQVVEAYRGPKYRRYKEAAKRLELYGFSNHFCKLKAFIKFEKQCLGKAPRVINPRSPEYNLELGRFLKFAEKDFFLAMRAAFGSTVVVKGYDHFGGACVLREHWTSFTDPVAVGLDAKKFDMHVSAAALMYEHCFYVRSYARCSTIEAVNRLKTPRCGCSGTVDRLCWLLQRQVHNVGSARFPDGRIKFAMMGTRSSGDLNTSCGNCIIMCALVWSYAARQRIDVRLANNGDDCVVFLERRDLRSFTRNLDRYFVRFGFRMVVEPPVDIFERIEFCQSFPVFDGKHWRCVRHPRVVIQKAAMCLLPIKTVRCLRKWLMAVGLCEGYIYNGVPVLSAWAQAYRRSGVYASLRYQQHVYKNTSRGYAVGERFTVAPITTPARVSFFKAFGITPEQQVALEQFYQKWRFVWDPICLDSYYANAKPMFDFEAALVMLAGSKF